MKQKIIFIILFFLTSCSSTKQLFTDDVEIKNNENKINKEYSKLKSATFFKKKDDFLNLIKNDRDLINKGVGRNSIFDSIAFFENEEMLDLIILLKLKIDIKKIENKNVFPLLRAARHSLEFAKKFHKLGFSYDKKNSFGNNLLYIAIQNEDIPLLLWGMELNIDPNQKGFFRKNLLDNLESKKMRILIKRYIEIYKKN